MVNLNLIDGLYIHPTPGGAYHAVCASNADISRRLLRELLQKSRTPELTMGGLKAWSGVERDGEVLQLLHHIQELGWIQGLEEPLECSEQALEVILPDLLKALAGKGKALLADAEGFYLAYTGFPHEVAEELSGLSAELATLHDRRSGVLTRNLGLGSSAWAIVDAVGNSKVGFWPLYIGEYRFVLVISGVPYLNQPTLVDLIWTLSRRYASAVG